MKRDYTSGGLSRSHADLIPSFRAAQDPFAALEFLALVLEAFQIVE
jgi:hypothetical protein